MAFATAPLEKSLNNADDAAVSDEALMVRRLAIVFGMLAVGLVLNGCTKCGPIWDDWLQSPKSCKADRF